MTILSTPFPVREILRNRSRGAAMRARAQGSRIDEHPEPERRAGTRIAASSSDQPASSLMLKLYGFSRVNKVARGNTRDLRVLWALEEMGMPFEIVGIDHPNHDLDAASYRALNPFGQIPVIDDDGVVVTESGAILLSLART